MKTGFVGIIGRPNVGKSTLLNAILGEKIALTTEKPQTTRNAIRGIYTHYSDDELPEDLQMIFIDTPGIHRPRTKLGSYMTDAAIGTLKEVDAIIFIVDDKLSDGPGDKYIVDLLDDVVTPKILVINKIDTVKVQEEILTFIAAYKDVCDFAEIVPLSALKDKNTDVLLEQIFKYLPYGPQFYDEDTVTDQPMRQIAAELIREKALRLLDDEIPHGIAVVIEQMKERPNGIIDIEASIVCERESHKGIIIGKGGSMLKKIGTVARREIENMMETKVNLQLWVKVRKEWRDSELYMKNYGYNQKDV